jgi:hypothetical protein
LRNAAAHRRCRHRRLDRSRAIPRDSAEDAFYAAAGTRARGQRSGIARRRTCGSQGRHTACAGRGRTVPTALPAGTPLNVNTAPPEVGAVVDKLEGEALAKLVAARAQSPFNNLVEFRAQLASPATAASDETLSVKSDFFYVKIEAQQGADVLVTLDSHDTLLLKNVQVSSLHVGSDFILHA